MSKYLDILPKECTNQEEGIIRAIIVEDMLKHGTIIAEMEKQGMECKYFLKDSVEDILEALYRSEYPLVIWNKDLKEQAALFKFDENNQKAIMLFPMTVPGFKQSYLEDVIARKGGKEMAKICPKTGGYVLYLDCKECENRADCEER